MRGSAPKRNIVSTRQHDPSLDRAWDGYRESAALPINRWGPHGTKIQVASGTFISDARVDARQEQALMC